MSAPDLSAMEFQFLIVRLKWLRLKLRNNSMWVSIPYSTIKMALRLCLICLNFKFQFLIVRLKFRRTQSNALFFHVSIPYSTIKIYQCEYDDDYDMVSIPYSTIKMLCNMRNWQAFLKFQFLIVRLKFFKVPDCLFVL